MSLFVSVLGSGSSGNCTYVASGNSRILIDAGLSGRETARRLESLRVDPASIDAVCLTHEHNDHRSSIGVLHRQYAPALFANAGTLQAINGRGGLRELPWNVFSTGTPFEVGDLCLTPFSVPHDSYDPVGFVVSAGEARVGVVTDMGMATALIRERLRPCGLLIVEANHDPELLRDARRPWSLKQRIAGRQGHLSNEQAAELIAELAGPGLSHVFLAHLSADCNRPHLALSAVSERLARQGHAHVTVAVAYPDRPTELVAAG